MNDCDKLLKEVIAQARMAGIPVSEKIDPHVRINRRAVARFGCCKFEKDRQIIELALRIAQGPEKSCRETLAHEILHTCWGCRDHGERWRRYARQMNEAYGYEITRAATNQQLGVEEEKGYKYLLLCEKCGAEFRRFRASRLTREPQRYRCRCGGRLQMVTQLVDDWGSKESGI